MADYNAFQQQKVENNRGKPLLQCKIHESSYYEAININSDSETRLVCFECCIESKLDMKQMVSLNQIFSPKQNQIIANWPPLQDQQLQQQLNSMNQQENTREKMIERVDLQFSDLKKSIIQIINEHHKGVLVAIDQIEEHRQNLYSKYSQISEKEDLKRIILDLSIDQNKLSLALKQKVLNIQQQQKENQQVMKECLDSISNYKSKLNILKYEGIQKQIIKMIEAINFQNLSFNSELQSINERDDNNNSLEQIKKYPKLNDIQKNQKAEEMSDVLMESTQAIKSQKCGNPEFVTINKLPNNSIEITNDGNDAIWRQVYIDREIAQSDKIVVNVELQSHKSYNSNMMIGLLPASSKDKHGWFNNLSLYTENKSFGLSKIIQGQHLSEIKKDVTSITFQICLSEKKYRCYSLVNGQKNIIELFDWNEINTNQIYHFYVAQYHSNSKILIKQFKKVDSFIEF